MAPLPDPKHALFPPWCLIESSPESFQGMTHMYGVRGVEVQEVLSLDDLLAVNRPVHGLIMSSAIDFERLSKESVMDSDAASLFFSCQVVTNVCATSALLGVLLNIEDNDLVIGDELKQFKDFTKDFNPVDRGMAIANSPLLQKAHNTFTSFESKMAAKQYPQYRDIKPEKYTEEDHPDYHFVAFIPAKGYIWELDGYNKVPIRLHKITHNWLEHIVSELKERMHKSGDVNFNMLALTKSLETTSFTSQKAHSASSSTAHNPSKVATPVTQEQRSIAAQEQHVYMQLIYRIEGYLDIISQDWRQHTLTQLIAMDEAQRNIQNELTINPLWKSDESIARLISSTANRASVISLLKLLDQARDRLYALIENSSAPSNRSSANDHSTDMLLDDDRNLLRRQHDYGSLINGLFAKLDDENLL